MWEIVRVHAPDIFLLTETHVGQQQPLPAREGYTAFQAAGPRAGRGGVAAYVRSGMSAEIWRSNPKDGVLWLRLPGALPGGRTLFLAVCYWPPRPAAGKRRPWKAAPRIPAGSTRSRHRRQPCSRARREAMSAAEAADEEDQQWLARRAAEWVAASALGVPLIAGDLNSRIGTAPDWPPGSPAPPPRHSCDSRLLPRGRLLLQWCQEYGARVCNGRVAGDQHGAATSYGTRLDGSAVVDFFLAPAAHLPSIHSLQVTDNAAVHDHACLVLEMAAATQPGCPQPQEAEADPTFFRFRPPATAEELETAVAALVSSPALPQLESAAEAAMTPAAVDAVGRQRCLAAVAACQEAGLRQLGQGRQGKQGQRPRQRRLIPHGVAEQFGLSQLRQALQATRPGSPEHRAARHALQRTRRAAHRAAKAARAVQLERQMLEDHDSAGFHAAWRGPRPSLPDWVLQNPDSLFEHFQALLSPPPPSNPAPTAAQAPPLAAANEAPGPSRRPLHGQALPGAENTGAHQVGWSLGAGQDRGGHEPHTPEHCQAWPGAENTGTAQGRTPDERPDAAAARVAMHQPFTPAETAQLLSRVRLRKAVVGPLAPWLAKGAAGPLSRPVCAEFNSWQRVCHLPCSDNRSAISPVPKCASPATPADFRGIAVGALLAKLYAMGLERRVSDYTEAASKHAEGQFGFRRQRSTEHAIFVLRTLVDRHRQQRQRGTQPSQLRRGAQLWACFVDFKQAYDRVPRDQLWAKLMLLGYDGPWLRAARAIYTEVPMSVNVPGLPHRVFQAQQGLKQGCPLSPTLFCLYISDFEQRVLEAATSGQQLDLPELQPGRPVPPLLYADDMALLATSATGLQAQLDLLESYCQQWGLTVNITKTKVMLLAGGSNEADAMRLARRARLTYGGKEVEAVPEFKYLGVVFHCHLPIGESAAPARAAVARFAAVQFEGRCAELGLEAARLLLLLFDSLVDSTLSYAAAVWAPGLAAAAAARPVISGGARAASSSSGTSSSSNTASEAELQHLRFLRRLLGLPVRVPVAVVLAEAGQPPLYVRWLAAAVRLWNNLVSWPADCLVGQAVRASVQQAAEIMEQPSAQQPGFSAQPWAAQLARALQQVGVDFAPQQLGQLSVDSVRRAALEQHLQRVQAALDSHTRLRHYFQLVRPDCMSVDSYGLPDYVVQVREQRSKRALAELRCGVHWGAEELGRFIGLPRSERQCPHCHPLGGPGGIEDVEHILFHCPLYAPERSRFPELFTEPLSLQAFLEQPAVPLARFADACRRHGRAAAGLPP